MSRRFLKVLAKTGAAVFALGATGTTVQSLSAQELAPATDLVQGESAESAALTEYPALLDPKTQARLDEFNADATLKASLEAVSKALAGKKPNAQQLEKDVLPLVEGRTLEDAEVSLDAVMLHHLATHLTQSKSADAAIKSLEARDTVLTEAAFGAVGQALAIDRPRALKMHRR